MQNKILDSIGFDDSEIVSYKSEEGNLKVYLKKWNEEILEFEFIDCILFLTFCNWSISNVVEQNHSDSFQKALQIAYENIPKDHPYKLFHFIDLDGDVAIEVACANMNIRKI